MEKQAKLQALEQKIVMSNILVQQTEYKLTLTEMKCILFIISKIRPQDTPYTKYTFSIKDFCELSNKKIDGGKWYDYIRDSLLDLNTKTVIIRPDENREIITSWFAEAELNTRTNEFTVSFAPSILPHLFNLTSKFVQYHLEDVMAMKSIYGILLFAYLKSVQFQGIHHIVDIDKIKSIMGCAGKYELTADVRKYIIEPAVKDINTFSSIKVDYHFIKEGRKITHIAFTITPTPDGTSLVNTQKALGITPK